MAKRTVAKQPSRRLQVDYMTRTERVAAAVNGEEVDRVPVCFWHHFQPDGSGRALADATVGFFDEEFDLDIAKIMPDLPYPFPRKSIVEPGDWRMVELIDPTRSVFFRERTEAAGALRDTLGFGTPIVMTIYSPLTEAMRFAQSKEQLLDHLRTYPVLMHDVLAVLAENLANLMREVLFTGGADGIFFSIQGCTKEIMTEAEYREFGRPYDLMALRGAMLGWLNILHIHGQKDLYFDLALDYPVQVLSWSDRIAGPSLREARVKTSKCLMGGWNEFGALYTGPVEQIAAEAQDAIAQTGGRKLILANGCSVPDDTDHDWLEKARAIAHEMRPGA